MIIFDKLLVKGVSWVLRRVADAAASEMNDESTLREELLAAEMRLELGEIDEHEFQAVESRLIERMREIRAARGPNDAPPGPGRFSVDSIEADVGDEESPAPRRRRAAR